MNGIKPILDNVDCELIITDTGSTDRTVEIAQKFTEKVLHFEWINDFAAARNTALEIAKGEWFMFLDADEIFESCDNIIDFFNSGEYRKYSAATYTVRNLLDDKKTYTDFMASRLTKRYPDTKFMGIIHEYLLHYTYPIKNIPDIALHYGYLFENKKQSSEKAKRNTDLLKKMLSEGNYNNPLIFLHLYDSCKMSGDKAEALKYLEKGTDYCQKNHSPYIASYYYIKALYYVNEGEELEAAEICKEYFGIKAASKIGNLTTDIEIYGLLAGILCDHLNFGEALTAYRNYFDIYEDVKTGNLNTDDASALNFRVAIEKNYIEQLYSFLDCCIICHEYDVAITYLTYLPIYKYNGTMSDIEILVDKIMIILENSGYSKAYNCYTQLNEYGRNVLVGKLLGALYSKDAKNEIIEQLKHIGDDIEWLKYKADIYESYFIKNNLTNDMIVDYIQRFGAYNDPDLLKISMDKQLDISCFFKQKISM